MAIVFEVSLSWHFFDNSKHNQSLPLSTIRTEFLLADILVFICCKRYFFKFFFCNFTSKIFRITSLYSGQHFDDFLAESSKNPVQKSRSLYCWLRISDISFFISVSIANGNLRINLKQFF